jgi:hypothetical protein
MLPCPYFAKQMAHSSISLLVTTELNYFTYITTEYRRLIEGRGLNQTEKFTVLSQIRHLSVKSHRYNKS